MNPIEGKRYKCLICPDFDLCEVCKLSGNQPLPCDDLLHLLHISINHNGTDMAQGPELPFTYKFLQSTFDNSEHYLRS